MGEEGRRGGGDERRRGEEGSWEGAEVEKRRGGEQ